MSVIIGRKFHRWPREGDIIKLGNGRHVVFIHDMLDEYDDIFVYNTDDRWCWCRSKLGQGMIKYEDIKEILEDMPQFDSMEDKLNYLHVLDKLDGSR